MKLSVTVRGDFKPVDERAAAEAAAEGVSNCIVEHLRRRNTSAKRMAGMPKSDYWADAAESVTTEVDAGAATVTIEKEGVALHYYGGVVYPVRGKALAIPIDPSVAGMNPREVNAVTGGIAMFWPKNSSHGFLKDEDSGELLWLLVARSSMKADPTVLPTVSELEQAACDYILEGMS